MLLVRGLVVLLLAAGAGFLIAYMLTGQKRYQALGVRLVKWTVIAALGFFAVLIVEQLATMR
jgi:hypothetical protein